MIYEPSFLLCSLSVEITLFVYQFSVTSKEAGRLTTFFVLYSFKKIVPHGLSLLNFYVIDHIIYIALSIH